MAKSMKNFKKILLFTSFLFLSFILLQRVILTEEQSIQLVNGLMLKEDVNNYAVTSECVEVWSKEENEYFQVEYHESKNGEECENTGTALLIGMYRVYKTDKHIEKYDVISNVFIKVE